MPFFPETHLKVLPVILYTRDSPASSSWSRQWISLLQVARAKFKLMLKERDTFDLIPQAISVQGKYSGKEYREFCYKKGETFPKDLMQCTKGVETILAELLLHPEISQNGLFNRYTLPYALAVLLIDPQNQWVMPSGSGNTATSGGRIFNGYINRGGGILVFPDWFFTSNPTQKTSTVVHELGHSLGLVHSWDRKGSLHTRSQQYQCYYHPSNSPSVMSYNTDLWNGSMDANEVPGCLLGDEIETLSRNKLFFKDLYFNPQLDFECEAMGPDCPPHDGQVREVYMGPMYTFWGYTDSGELFGSDIRNLSDKFGRRIRDNAPKTGFDPKTMWHSGEMNRSGWVSMELSFPIPVSLDKVIVYAQHSGKHHRPDSIQLEKQERNGGFSQVIRIDTDLADSDLNFAPTESRVWKLAFRAGKSGFVVIRGLRFFHKHTELFPPVRPIARTAFGQIHGSSLQNLTEIQRMILPNHKQVGFDPETMWHSGPSNEKGWVSVEIAFPEEIFMDQLRVYSEHSGAFHLAREVQVEVRSEKGEYVFVKRKKLAFNFYIFTWKISNAKVRFKSTEGQFWKFSFRTQAGDPLVIRGLRFFSNNSEIFPASQTNVK